MSLQSQIETVLTQSHFNYSAVQIKSNGAVLIRRLLTPDDEIIITSAKAMIFKPLQRDGWILAELLGTTQPADEYDAVSYWVQTNLQGDKEAVFFLYPDKGTVSRHLSQAMPQLSAHEQAEISAAVALVETTAEVSFVGDMATITLTVSPHEATRAVHELIFALGTSKAVYGRGLAWYHLTGNWLTVQLHPNLKRVAYSLRRERLISEAEARRKVGNWTGRERASVVAQAVSMVKQGVQLEKAVRVIIETFYSGVDKAKARLKLRQEVLKLNPKPQIPRPVATRRPQLTFAFA